MNMTNEIPPVIGTDARARQWAMLCHLIALVGLLGNGIGFLLGPLIVWLIKKDAHPFIDEQGREALNFQLTMLLAAIVCIPLTFVVIGAFILPVIGILAVLFPIIAGVNANSGNSYRYPLTIRFVK